MLVHPSSVMLFAAGFGTRMGTMTARQPKSMIPVNGRPLIDHALDLVRAVEPEKIVVNLHYLPEVLQSHLFEAKDIIWSHEEPDILETGGGLRAALPLLGSGPTFTMNTDAVWQGPNPLKQLSALWDPKKMDALLLLVPKDRAFGHNGPGDFQIDDQGRAFRGPDMTFTGLQIIKTNRLSDIRRKGFSLNLLWDLMLQDKSLYASPYAGKWCDVGRPECIKIAESMLEANDV